MRSKSRSGKSATSLDEKQKVLLEQQESLRQKMERLERLIEEAPRRAEREEKKRREELMARAASRPRRAEASVLTDRRYELHELQATLAAPRPSRKSLKAEKRQAKLTFFALALVLTLVLLWLRHMMP